MVIRRQDSTDPPEGDADGRQVQDEIICEHCGSPHHRVRTTIPLDPPRGDLVRVRYHICHQCGLTFASYLRRANGGEPKK